MAIQYDGKSNYARTALNRKYLELYEPLLKSENLSAETITFIVESKHNKRPDLLAFEMYGSSRLWWVFAHYNRDTLNDPIMDFTSGTKIKAPRTFRITRTN